MKNVEILGELEQISMKHKGLLMPEDVVEFAKDTETALHSKFTWDDSEAAQRYRVWEARMIIASVTVTVRGKDDINHRAFVSLSDDRSEGGYRTMVTVMGNEDLRALLLQDALEEMEVFRKKYNDLMELSKVFVEIEKAKERFKNKKKTVRKTNLPARVNEQRLMA